MIGLSCGARHNRKFDQMMSQTASLSYKFVSFSDVSQNAQGSIFGPLKNPNNIYSLVANMNSYSWQKFVSLQYTNFLERCDIASSGLAFDCCFSFFFWGGFVVSFFVFVFVLVWDCSTAGGLRFIGLSVIYATLLLSFVSICFQSVYTHVVSTQPPPKVSSYSYWEVLIVLEHLIARKNGALEKQYIY